MPDERRHPDRRRGTVVVGLFPDPESAERGVRALNSAGFGRGVIGIAMRQRSANGEVLRDQGSRAAEGAMAGAVATAARSPPQRATRAESPFPGMPGARLTTSDMACTLQYETVPVGQSRARNPEFGRVRHRLFHVRGSPTARRNRRARSRGVRPGPSPQDNRNLDPRVGGPAGAGMIDIA